MASMLVAGVVVMAPALAWAEWEFLGGFEGDTHDTGFAFGAVGYLHPVTPRLDLAVRAAGSYLYYSFPENGGETRVTSPGITLLAGPRFSGRGISLTLMAGAEARTIERETETPAGRGRTSEDEVGPVANGTLWAQLSPRWDFLGLINYDSANTYTWGRASLKYQLTDGSRPLGLALGPEATLQGNPDIFSVQGGGVGELSYRPLRLSLALRLGYKRSTFEVGPAREGLYGGIALYKLY